MLVNTKQCILCYATPIMPVLEPVEVLLLNFLLKPGQFLPLHLLLLDTYHYLRYVFEQLVALNNVLVENINERVDELGSVSPIGILIY